MLVNRYSAVRVISNLLLMTSRQKTHTDDIKSGSIGIVKPSQQSTVNYPVSFLIESQQSTVNSQQSPDGATKIDLTND